MNVHVHVRIYMYMYMYMSVHYVLGKVNGGNSGRYLHLAEIKQIHRQRLHKQLLLSGRNLPTASIDFRLVLFQRSNKI